MVVYTADVISSIIEPLNSQSHPERTREAGRSALKVYVERPDGFLTFRKPYWRRGLPPTEFFETVAWEEVDEFVELNKDGKVVRHEGLRRQPRS